MLSKLKVTFDDIEFGWVGLSINCGDDVLSIDVSYTPYDSFLDLTNALHKLLRWDGLETITWNTEPIEYDFIFSRKGARINLNIKEYPDCLRAQQKGEKLFEVAGTYKQVCLPFWRALRDLQGRFSQAELDRRWHRPFPVKEMNSLTKAIKANEVSE